MIRLNPAIIAAVITLSVPTGDLAAEDLSRALSPEELQSVREAADRGLLWLSTQQNEDGSYNGLRDSEKAPSSTETCYALLAFLSRGHQPNQGRYRNQMQLAIDWLLSIQRPDGSFSTRDPALWPSGQEHSLASLTMSEVFAVTSAEQTQRVGNAIERALAFTHSVQASPKQHEIFEGGWGFDEAVDRLSYRRKLATVTETSQSLVFLRSAHSAGFEVPQIWVKAGLAYISRCYQPGPHNENVRRLPVAEGQGVFRARPPMPAGIEKEDLRIPSATKYPYNWTNFNTTAAGILALAMTNRREDPMVPAAAEWLARRSIPRQGTINDFYFTCYISSEAISQVGGEHWKQYYPRMIHRLLPHQDRNGRFRQDTPRWRIRSSVYCTALAVLTLTLPDQLLPIHQR